MTRRAAAAGREVAAEPIPVAFCWSGGKDSAHALGRLLGDERYRLQTLVTTVQGPDRVSTVHELPLHLIRAQAAAIGVPLELVVLAGPGLEGYVDEMTRTAHRLHDDGVRAVAFGDLDVSRARHHHEELFEPTGLAVVEPLAGMTSQDCIADFLRSRIVAVTVVVDAHVLGREHLGVRLDEDFIAELPHGCDPCGELGEYHTFVSYAPYFSGPVRFVMGESTYVERRIGTHDGPRSFGHWQLRLE